MLFVYLAFILKFHLVRDEIHNSVMLWNSQEAYIFARWSRAGYHFTCFQYLFGYVPAFFGLNHTYDDLRSSTLVIRITPKGIGRYVVERDTANPKGDPVDFRAYFPVGPTIYAADVRGDLWKWAGADFERVRPEDQREVINGDAPAQQQDFQNISGWSTRHDVYRWQSRSSIELEDKPILFLLRLGNSGDELSLEVQLPNGAPQNALHVDGHLHLVGQTKYKEMFKRPSEPH